MQMNHNPSKPTTCLHVKATKRAREGGRTQCITVDTSCCQSRSIARDQRPRDGTTSQTRRRQDKQGRVAGMCSNKVQKPLSFLGFFDVVFHCGGGGLEVLLFLLLLGSALIAAGRRHATPGLRRQPPSFLLFPQTSLLVFPRGTLTSLGSP
eukprot:SAG31_NODE_773_length_12173_cov_15.778173_3_plen_151_part_00